MPSGSLLRAAHDFLSASTATGTPPPGNAA
jgi:hypothetical protein